MSWLSTHPPIEERVARLRAMNQGAEHRGGAAPHPGWLRFIP